MLRGAVRPEIGSDRLFLRYLGGQRIDEPTTLVTTMVDNRLYAL